MGRKRISLGRAEALIENLNRDLSLAGTNLKNAGILKRVYTVDGTAGAQTVVMTSTSHVPGSIISVLADDSGGDDVIITLPAAEGGLSYTFVAQATGGAGGEVTIKSAANNMEGVLVLDDATADITAKGKIEFAAEKWVKGTTMECSSDGTNWYVNVNCLAVVGDGNQVKPGTV